MLLGSVGDWHRPTSVESGDFLDVVLCCAGVAALDEVGHETR
jgi:hypothetical protein